MAINPETWLMKLNGASIDSGERLLHSFDKVSLHVGYGRQIWIRITFSKSDDSWNINEDIMPCLFV